MRDSKAHATTSIWKSFGQPLKADFLFQLYGLWNSNSGSQSLRQLLISTKPSCDLNMMVFLNRDFNLFNINIPFAMIIHNNNE